ncbi:GspMb/PilO family protein [Clostridium weizhouense]|uniref:Pilus assembly protein PilO n=1 Tax=Clostridium weizhouense TaxID=2859781 RepID=A0ABS7ARA6_9CLOT|nr:GspMb/PilO family protein [Clostridium weizhouense]MBW6410206.1 pilus assembly protein PilO [Clostridium weizhouense]
MKISKREKMMLCILGIVLISILYYQFIYLKQTSKIADKTKSKNEIEEKYNNSINTINALDKRKSDIKVLDTKVKDKSSLFFPTISQEHIILELDQLLKKSGLDGGFNFKPIAVEGVESSEKTQENLKESSLQSMVDNYKAIDKNNKNSSVNSKSNQSEETQVSSSNSEIKEKKSQTSEGDSNKSNDSKKTSIEQIKLELNFNGSYAQLNNFLNSIRLYNRKIVVNSISINQKTLEQISGNMNVEIYAVPKIHDDLEEYLKWSLNNTYGKNDPFSGEAAGNSIVSKDEKTSDFIMSSKSNTSVLPTVMIGKSNDSLRTSYVYEDSNNQEEIEIVLTKNDDKYYYKYKTTNESYPSQYGGLGVEFIPVSDNIVIDVLSESRVTSNDKSGVKISIKNDTDKLVKVEISGDDTKDPRVVVNGDGKNISVSNK